VRDWLDLVYQSIHNPEKPIVNLKNKGIEKAVELIDYDKLSSKEITAMKDAEMKRQALSKKEDKARKEGVKEGLKKGLQEAKIAAIIKALNKNLPLDLIAELNDVTVKFVAKVQNELHKPK
jgi:predicted transposase YdaD